MGTAEFEMRLRDGKVATIVTAVFIDLEGAIEAAPESDAERVEREGREQDLALLLNGASVNGAINVLGPEAKFSHATVRSDRVTPAAPHPRQRPPAAGGE